MSTPVTRLAAVLAALALSLALAAPVLGHAELESSSPAAGTIVTAPVTMVELRFTEGLDAGKSSFRLDGPVGEVGSVRPARDGAKVMRLAGFAAGLEVGESFPQGEYRVSWTAAAEDGHVERGTFRFTIEAEPASASPSAEPSDAPSAAPSDAPSEAPSNAPSAAPTAAPPASAAPSPSAAPDEVPVSGSTGDVLLPIVVGLLLAGVGGAYLLRRNRAA